MALVRSGLGWGSSSGGGGGGGSSPLAAVTLGAGPTNITHAAHSNRQVNTEQSATASVVFAGTATSGAVDGDIVTILNTGSGWVFASGNVVAAPGMKLWADENETLSFQYYADDDTYYGGAPEFLRQGQTQTWRMYSANNAGGLVVDGLSAVNMYDSCTQVSPFVPGTGNFTKFQRGNLQSVAATNRISGANYGSSGAPARMPTAATRSYDKFRFVFGPNDAVAVTDAKTFVGLSENALTVGVEPDTILNFIGLIAKSTQANLQIASNDASGTATMVDLGASFPANSTGANMYELILWLISDGTAIRPIVYQVTDRIARAGVTGTISSDLPAAGTTLGAHIARAVGAGSSAVTVAMVGMFAGAHA